MFPAASVAVQVTVVVPTEKLEPEAGEQPPTIVAGGEASNWLNRIESVSYTHMTLPTILLV